MVIYMTQKTSQAQLKIRKFLSKVLNLLKMSKNSSNYQIHFS